MRRGALAVSLTALGLGLSAGFALRVRRLLEAPRDLRHVGLLLPVNVYNGHMLKLGACSCHAATPCSMTRWCGTSRSPAASTVT